MIYIFVTDEKKIMYIMLMHRNIVDWIISNDKIFKGNR